MIRQMNWDLDGRGWPNREGSTFVHAGGMRWHVQIMGQGPVLLMLHGTGSSTHSWADLAPILAQYFTLVMPDLPGQGFSTLPKQTIRLDSTTSANLVHELLQTIAMEPQIAFGHSAGAAILVRMSLNAQLQPCVMIGENPALIPWRGVPAKIFPPAARLLADLPVASQLAAWWLGRPNAVKNLLLSTGSHPDSKYEKYYQKLVECPGHVFGALKMMANWDLESLLKVLPNLKTPLWVLIGDKDLTVPPTQSLQVAKTVVGAKTIRMPELGHLAHEEAPSYVAEKVLEIAKQYNLA